MLGESSGGVVAHDEAAYGGTGVVGLDKGRGTTCLSGSSTGVGVYIPERIGICMLLLHNKR